MMDFNISMVAAAQATDTTPTTLRTVMAQIASPRWQAQVQEVRDAYEFGGKDEAADPKKRLPGVLFSGTFSRRAAAALTQHSGLICVDLDELDNRVATVRETIQADPHTLAAFVSPTGSGLKVIFRCDPTKPHADSFHAAEEYVKTHFGLAIDKACKDVSRLCFVSHDPEAFIADDAEPLPYPAPKPVEFRPTALGLDLRPGDDYDARCDLATLLTNHGWTKDHGKNWTRPGKNGGPSASLDHVPGRFHVFTSSTEFSANHTYKPWHVYAILEHGGDWHEAAKALARQGFGTPSKRNQLPGERYVNEGTAPAKPVAPIPQARPIFTLALPDANDASSILGNRYINRGDGAVLSSSSGMGKSAMAIQMAIRWSLGMDTFGIKPARPLRVLYIQSEDSDGDVAEVTASIAHVLSLTPDQIAQVNANVVIVTDRVSRGPKFLLQLKQHIESHKPDLVVINPLQAFMDGDITASQDIGAFLREGLNALNEPAQFAYLLIHHTTKPATGKDRSERLWHEQMYDMAGGAEIINWARAILSLKATEEPGHFNLHLAKRGRRAGVTRQVEQGTGFRLEPVITIPLKHSDAVLPSGQHAIYWEPRTPDAPASKVVQGGRPDKFMFDQYRNVFPPRASEGKVLSQLWMALKDNGEIPKASLHKVCVKWADEGHVQIIDQDGSPRRYRRTL